MRMKLEMKVASLGQELYGKGADFVFPVQFIYSELERKFVLRDQKGCREKDLTIIVGCRIETRVHRSGS